MFGISAHGTAFWAMSVEVNTKTKQQLEAEENIEQTSDASKTSKSNSVANESIAPSADEQTVIFTDPTNGNFVKINLSKENIQKLKEHFTDENSFYDRKDGSVRLNGKAEAFVSGWFGDIAYKREFLKADANGDGKLSEDEYQNTRNAFNGMGRDYLLSSNKGIAIEASEETLDEKGTYSKVSNESKLDGMVKYNDAYKADSISSELNTTIKIDKDFSSTTELAEAYKASNKNKNLSTEDIVVGHINAYYKINASKMSGFEQQDANMFEPMIELMNKISKKMKLKKEDLADEKAQKALQKLLAANGNESVLSMEEKKALGAELKAIKKQLESKDDLSSVKEEIKTKVENTQFIDVRG
jgi:hypothetical protein